MKFALCAALLGGLITLPALASAQPGKRPSVITNPDWAERPSAEDVSRFYPTIASELELQGRVVVSCQVTGLGQLENCEIVEETPKGLGFHDAGLALAARFRMKPMTRDGVPVEGGHVRIPLTFIIPPPDPAGQAIRPASSRAQALAREIVETDTRYVAPTLSQWDMRIREMEFTPPDDSPPEVAAAYVVALKAARDEVAELTRQSAVAALADTFDEVQLAAIVAYYKTPGGAVQKLDDMQRAYLQQAAGESSRLIQARQRASFCRDQKCAPDPAEVARIVQDVAKAGVKEPAWAEAPDQAQLYAAMPLWAGYFGVSGQTLLGCKVIATGLLAGCEVTGETPKGFGFGAAALGLATQFRLAPFQITQGAPGETVAVPIYFAAAELPAPAPAPTPRSVVGAKAALDFLRATRMLDNVRVAQAAQSADMAKAARAGADPTIDKAAEAALKTGFEAVSAEVEDRAARALANIHTPEQLASAAAFGRTPAGQAYYANQLSATEKANRLMDDNAERITAKIRVEFCKIRTCALLTPRAIAPQTSEKPAAPSTAHP